MLPAAASTGVAAGVHGVGSLCFSRPAAIVSRRQAICHASASAHSAATAAAKTAPSSFLSSAASQRSAGIASTSGRETLRSRGSARWHRHAGSDQVDSAEAIQAGFDSDEAQAFDFDFDADGLMQELSTEYIEYCRERFEIEDLVEIGPGVNDLPAVYLRHPNGSQVEVYLHGANITSWQKPNGEEILYVRPDNTFDGFQPIKGGIPVIFPQYGRGVLPTNGFMRQQHWSIAATGIANMELASDPAPSVALFTQSDETSLAVWPHKFEAMYTISLMESDDFEDPTGDSPNGEGPLAEVAEIEEAAKKPQPKGRPPKWSPAAGGAEDDFEEEEVDEEPLQLRCVLEICNTGEDEFTFTSGLQTHFTVRQLGDYPDNSRFVKLLGLAGKYNLNYGPNPVKPRLDMEAADYVHFGEEPVDRIYVDTQETDVMLTPGDRTHHEIINRRGFRDTGAMNPYTRMPEAYRHFVAITSARVARPVTLKPGEVWSGEMVIRSYDSMWQRPLFELNSLRDGPRRDEPPPPNTNIMPQKPNFPTSYS